MSKNLGPLVSRVLDQEGRNFTDVIFQQKRPPLDSEWNLVQEINNSKYSELLKDITPSGFLSLNDIRTAPLNRTELTSSWVNSFVINNPKAIVNGWVIPVGGGTNQFQPNAQKNIWEEISGISEEIAVIIDSAPYVGYREDLLFLEVWQKLVTTGDTVFNDGFTQSALPNNPNDLIDPNILIETSKRIQTQYRVRWVKGVDFLSFRNGLGHPACWASGGSGTVNSSYVFRKHTTDVGLWIAGNGNSQSQQDLNTVDGFSYAIPIARIHRRNRQAYGLTNKNGSSVSMLSGLKSDRPDGLYYDEISDVDVEDLRHKISLNGFDYNQLLEETVYNLWDRSLVGELGNSDLDENLYGKTLIQADGIAMVDRSGINDEGRDPDGVKRVFSDSEMNQLVSFSAVNPVINVDRVVFTPIGKSSVCENELWDENVYYISGTTPIVKVYDNSTLKFITTISGGTWEGLGEKRTWDFLTGDKNKVTYIPTDMSLIENKKVVFEFVFSVREGGGLNNLNSGFTHNIKNMLMGSNETDGFPIDFNLYNVNFTSVSLENYYCSVSATTKGPRSVGTYKDNAISRSIHRFIDATNLSNNFSEKYKAATLELSYYVLSTGGTSVLIEPILYERSVYGVLSVYNVSSQQYMTPLVEKQTGGYRLTGLVANVGDVLELIILCGNYTIDYVPHNRGISNIAKMYSFSDSISVNDTTGVMNLKVKNPLCDGVLATAGFFNGTTTRHIAYINNQMVFLSSIEGLGSALVKFTLATPSPVNGQIMIPFLGYYNPSSSDKFYFQYQYSPYVGIAKKRLEVNSVQQVKILKMDNSIMVSTAGTGKETQKVPKELMGLIETLPLNKRIKEYNFFGESITSPLSGGESSIRRIPGRSLASTTSGETYLREGQVIDLKLGNEEDGTDMLRGVIISNPKISERGLDFSTAFNHVNQWTALVEGLGDLVGEIFLMVITTTSTKYNAEESPEDEYLTQKGTYEDNALGKGKEVSLNNSLSTIQLSQHFGDKIYGAVDLFPLKYRPLKNPS